MMKKLMCLLGLFCFTGVALAEDFEETFPDPLGGYQSRWLYQNSNINSYYHSTGDCNIDQRGNNPCGLWFTDCQECGCGVGGDTVNIVFSNGFGDTITDISFDFTGYCGDYEISFLDNGGGVISTTTVGSTFDVCNGLPVSETSSNGVSEIVIRSTNGCQVEGNSAIDNVRVTTGPTTPRCIYQITKVKNLTNACGNATCADCPYSRGDLVCGAVECSDASECRSSLKGTNGCSNGTGCKIKAELVGCDIPPRNCRTCR